MVLFWKKFNNEAKIEALENKTKFLGEKVKSLEKGNPKSETSKAQTGTQTEDDDILFCQECEYPADDLFTLGEHVGEFHSENLVLDKVCSICDDRFSSEEFLTEHKTKNHRGESARQKYSNEENSDRKEHKFTYKFCEQHFEGKGKILS